MIAVRPGEANKIKLDYDISTICILFIQKRPKPVDEWHCGRYPCQKKSRDEPKHHEWFRHERKHHVYLCAWCCAADIVGSEFAKHLTTIHGYEFTNLVDLMPFIVEMKREFFALACCRRCGLRSSEKEGRFELHVMACTGRIRAQNRLVIAEHNVERFFREHEEELRAIRNLPAVESNPTARMKLWVGYDESGDEKVKVLEPRKTTRQMMAAEVISAVEDDRSTYDTTARLKFECISVKHAFMMFADLLTRFWGAERMDRRRLYFEYILSPGVYDVVVSIDVTLRMTVRDVAGYHGTKKQLTSEELNDAKTDEFEGTAIVVSHPQVVGAVISLDGWPALGSYITQRRDTPTQIGMITVSDRFCTA